MMLRRFTVSTRESNLTFASARVEERNSRHSLYNFEQLRTSGSRLSRKRTCHASEQYSADAKFIDRSFGWVAVIYILTDLRVLH